MADALLRFVVCTPHDLVLQLECRSVRIPCETGHVGLRPLMEATVVAVEPGVVLVRTAAGLEFVGTAGGLLTCDGANAELFTALAVTGSDGEEVIRELDKALSVPDAELEARAALGKLERTIASELRGEERAQAIVSTGTHE